MVLAPPTRLMALALLLLAAPLSGCLGGHSTPSVRTHATGPDIDLPADDRPPSVIRVDPGTPTVGTEHQHDYWSGAREATVFDANLPSGQGGACLGIVTKSSCYNGPSGASEIRLVTPDGSQRPTAIWPGTGKVTVDLQLNGQLLQPFKFIVRAPNRPNLVTRVVAATTSVAVDKVLENQTDDPHRSTSAWTFSLESAELVANGQNEATRSADAGSNAVVPGRASLYVGTLHVVIKLERSDRKLAVDPAHPDLWGGATRHRMVDAEHRGTNQASTNGPTRWFLLPENATVLPLSDRLEIDLTWTNSIPGQAPPGLVVCSPGKVCDSDGVLVAPSSSSDGVRHYRVPLRSNDWDSPYATKTMWAFGWVYDYSGLPAGAGDSVGNVGVLSGSIRLGIDLVKSE